MDNNENKNENNSSENQGYGYYGYQPYGGYGYNPPPKPPKKTNKVLVGVILVVVAALLIGAIALVNYFGDLFNAAINSGNNNVGGGLINSGDMINSDFSLTQPSTPGTMYTSLPDAYDATYKLFVEINMVSETDGLVGAGSGVIISRMKDNKGYYIVTNNHIVEDATKITVTLYDGTTYTAVETVLCDELTDIAVIGIMETRELDVAKLGKSENLRVGESVYIIGNPLGTLAGTLTNGIISAKAQEISLGNHYMELIQTNAQINLGNSGGPMFNMAGELVGIVNGKHTGVGVEGIGFAIPIDRVVNVVTQMITQGYVSGRHNLGITTEHNLYGVGGLWISDIDENSALLKAGLPYKSTYAYQIHMINGNSFINGSQANKYIDEQLKAGDTVSIAITVYEVSFDSFTPVEQKTYNITLAQKYANE